jgi:hypothetical protein
MDTMLHHSSGVTEPTDAATDADPAQRPARLVERARQSLVNRATGLVNVSAGDASRWYVATGEGTAVTAGGKELSMLEAVELDEVLGAKFGYALNSVVAITQQPELANLAGGERLRAAQQAYSDELDKKVD